MQSCDVATATSDGPLGLIPLGLDHLAGLCHRCAIWGRIDSTRAHRETLPYERIDIQAEVGPAISPYLPIWNAYVHLVRYDALCSIANH